MAYTKDQFSENLFWDVRFEDIDFQKHAPYIVQRILEYGADQDWRQLVSILGRDEDESPSSSPSFRSKIINEKLTSNYTAINVEKEI